jgi:hypothetical protein
MASRPERSAIVTERPHLELDRYFPYLINRVGFALVARFDRPCRVW